MRGEELIGRVNFGQITCFFLGSDFSNVLWFFVRTSILSTVYVQQRRVGMGCVECDDLGLR